MTESHKLNTLPVTGYSYSLKTSLMLPGSPSASSFRQYLDHSDEQSDTKQNNSVTQKRNQSADRKNSRNFDCLKQTALINPDISMLTNTHQMPCLLTLSGLNCVLPGKYSMHFSAFSRAQRFRRHISRLISHALNQTQLPFMKSEIIFESADCSRDKYILKIGRSGYSLTVQTQTQNFADELSAQATAFERYFRLKTGYKLEVAVSLQKRQGM